MNWPALLARMSFCARAPRKRAFVGGAFLVVLLASAAPARGQITEIIDATGDGLGNPLSIATGVAVDGAGNVFVAGRGSNNVFKIARPPSELIEELAAYIGTLVDDGVLKAGQANGLLKPLDNALRSLAKGHFDDACNQLDDFIAEVEEKTPTPLDAATASELIDKALAIKALIGCG